VAPIEGRIGERSKKVSIEEPSMPNLKLQLVRFEWVRLSSVHCWKRTAACWVRGRGLKVGQKGGRASRNQQTSKGVGASRRPRSKGPKAKPV